MWFKIYIVFVAALADETVYDGSQVYIYNKASVYYRLVTDRPKCEDAFNKVRSFPINLAYKVTKEYCPMYLYPHELKFEHLWTLEEHPTRHGKFYVRNTASPNDKWRYGTPVAGAVGRKHFLTKTVSLFSRKNFGNMYVSWDNSYHAYNLFTFEDAGNGYYFIKNSKAGCLMASPKISAVTCKKIKNYQSARWKLIPRIKEVKVKKKIIFGPVDNLQGPFPDGPYTITVQHGVTRTKTTEIRDLQSYKISLEASIGNALGAASVGFEFTQEIEKTMTTSEESSWVRTETRTVTVPARSKYAIVQYVADVEGELDEDSCQVLNGNVKIYVTNDRHFNDDDGKKIKLHKL